MRTSVVLTALFASTFFLASCEKNTNSLIPDPINSLEETIGEQQKAPAIVLDDLYDKAPADHVVWETDRIFAHITQKDESGKVILTTVESIAKEADLYNEKALYKPYEAFMFSENNPFLPAMYNNIIGMKKGEKKNFTLEPKEAFGEKEFTKTIPLTEIADIVSDIDKSIVKEPVLSVKVGQYILLDNWSRVKIEAIKDSVITVREPNPNNPFYGNELVVGLVWNIPLVGVATITALDDTSVTVNIVNAHPRAGQKVTYDVEISDIQVLNEKGKTEVERQQKEFEAKQKAQNPVAEEKTETVVNPEFVQQ